MTDENGRPAVGRGARLLGVRVAQEGDRAKGTVDICFDKAGMVSPKTGGMSVAPSWRDLPLHRIPQRLNAKLTFGEARGKDENVCWSAGNGSFQSAAFCEGLMLEVDGAKHGTVQPSARVSLSDYEATLKKTRDEWVRDET